MTPGEARATFPALRDTAYLDASRLVGSTGAEIDQVGTPWLMGLAALLERVLTHDVHVAMRFTSGVGGVRASTHFCNDEDDVHRLVAALEESI